MIGNVSVNDCQHLSLYVMVNGDERHMHGVDKVMKWNYVRKIFFLFLLQYNLPMNLHEIFCSSILPWNKNSNLTTLCSLKCIEHFRHCDYINIPPIHLIIHKKIKTIWVQRFLILYKWKMKIKFSPNTFEHWCEMVCLLLIYRRLFHVCYDVMMPYGFFSVIRPHIEF